MVRDLSFMRVAFIGCGTSLIFPTPHLYLCSTRPWKPPGGRLGGNRGLRVKESFWFMDSMILREGHGSRGV